MKLNIGAGDTVIDGYIAVDRKFGDEAYPLRIKGEPVADNSVDEIRASHVLEHFSFEDALGALKEWHRVLKPDGSLYISVPDMEKAARLVLQGNDNALFYIMGGQTDENDFHRAAFTKERLTDYMKSAGFETICEWGGDSRDTSDHPVSLNLMGLKPKEAPKATGDITLFAVVSRPRYGTNEFWDCAATALRPWNIPLNSFKGVFWGQCMERAFEEAVKKNIDWILTLDYDSQFTSKHISILMDRLGSNPEIDAIAALQCRRGKKFPLMTTTEMGESTGKPYTYDVDGSPILVTSAHFGLTLLRTECLKKMSKPWFWSTPDKEGGWGEGRFDDDIYFWHEWRKAGNTIYVAPDCRIGHIEEMVSEFDENMQPRHVYVPEWREANGLGKSKSA